MNLIKLYFLLVIILFSCSTTSTKNNKGIDKYDFKNPEQIQITSKLNEISDLANTLDGNIFTINDEIGIVYILNSGNCEIIKRFFLGKWVVEADFEGIAANGEFIFAITSNGNLYKFKEGENNASVTFKVENLPFSSKFEIEGLYFDKELDGLLILPKEYAGKGIKQQRAVYFYSFKSNNVLKQPVLLISLKDLKDKFGIKDFYPAGISKHPLTGNYFIVSARGENVLVEINKSGKIIGVEKLKENIHRQPEGITILPDYTLIISDEAAGKKPTITKYRYKK